MGNAGLIGYSQVGDSSQPSPNIFGDCPNGLLNDRGLGFYGAEDFVGGPTIPSGIVTAQMVASTGWGPVNMTLATDLTDVIVTHKAGEIKGYIDIQTGATDNDFAGFNSAAFGKVVKNSGLKLWFEARVELGAIADQGFFIGLAEEASITADLIVDGGASLIATDSFIGAEVLSSNTDALNFVYQKDGGTKVTVLADATNATAIPSDDRASLVADTEVKIGIRFNGYTKLTFYINGVKVATQTVDSTIDQSNNLAFVAALKTGTGAAQSFACDWVRFAYQERT